MLHGHSLWWLVGTEGSHSQSGVDRLPSHGCVQRMLHWHMRNQFPSDSLFDAMKERASAPVVKG